jgi:hypothetical protein
MLRRWWRWLGEERQVEGLVRDNRVEGRVRFSSLLATTVIGSYPQPDWLIDRAKLRGSLPRRVRAQELWRVDEPYLAQAQDDDDRIPLAELEQAEFYGL